MQTDGDDVRIGERRHRLGDNVRHNAIGAATSISVYNVLAYPALNLYSCTLWGPLQLWVHRSIAVIYLIYPILNRAAHF